MEERVKSWYPVRYILRKLEARAEREVILEDLESTINAQVHLVKQTLDSVVAIYRYRTRGIPNPKIISETISLENLECELYKLRSLLSDYTRSRHRRIFHTLAYREHSQNCAYDIAECFVNLYPRVRHNTINPHVDPINRMLYTELINGLVFDVMLSPIGVVPNVPPRSYIAE